MTNSPDVRDLWRRILAGYRNIAVGLAGTLGLIAGAAVVGVVVVTPLWLAATRATEIYTAVVLGLFAVALMTGLLRRIRLQRTGIFLPILKTTARVVAVAAGLYAMIVLFARGMMVPGAALALAGLFWLGYAASGGRKKRDADGAP